MSEPKSSNTRVLDVLRRAELIRYEHGGGRLAVWNTVHERELIADFYNEDTREFIYGLIQAALKGSADERDDDRPQQGKQLENALWRGQEARKRFDTGKYIPEDDADRMVLVMEIERLERGNASHRVNIAALEQEKSNLASRLRMIDEDSRGKPTGTCPGTTRGNLGANSPALRALLRRVADVSPMFPIEAGLLDEIKAALAGMPASETDSALRQARAEGTKP